MIRLMRAVFLFMAAGIVGQAQAHDLRPAYLAITESAPDIYAVTWKAPALGERRLAIYPSLPKSAVETTQREGAFLSDAYVERWTVRAPTGFANETITIDGLPETRTDVLVRIERLNGDTSTARLTPASPFFEIPASMGLRQVAAAYLGLGVEHILFGVDHLIFVLALILLVQGWKRICLTVTAFTVAHSITLGAATLGYLDVPGPPVEAAIALSIVLVAVEIVNVSRGQESLAARIPWLIAFAFGLLHGLGFAGALSAVGLPGHAIPIALLFFNIGVELGQLLFIAAVMALFAILRRLWFRVVGTDATWSHSMPLVGAAYCIGGVASFWLMDRVYGFWA
ncbi:HupE/UreJ family protein [Rhizobium laguerreae]|uniref:HupE/UreJ family protein n=1 Tax=Rhizobium laguerreae TaxID=1076926 RepID=UPI001C928E61|nr:HupE/UreJ family protein [Rhizobium laguerreae]MBY3088408.1 HupE/UreJ family protein [Rhizobium laguerreae]MBY3149388.1 HupE/UreJ family protein [Rhizobium laguerreae]